MRLNPSFGIVLIGIISSIDAYRVFHHGRMVGGNLGKPVVSSLRGFMPVAMQFWFVQKLDHFNSSDTRTWKQRYFYNNMFYESAMKGPVFLMIGGEGPASKEWMTEGTWVDYAAKSRALLILLEHRYYGESRPTTNLSTDNLVYLSSRQALADLAFFISNIGKVFQLPSDTKWIVFGGSYPGSLAAWLSSQYPHLVHGAMSASGPLLAQVDFKAYFDVVRQSLSTHSRACVSAIQQGVEQVDQLLKTEKGQLQLKEMFKLCSPEDNIVSANDISSFYEAIADNFAGVVQYNKDNRIGVGKPKNITIDTVCDIMVNETRGSAVYRLGNVNSLLLSAYGLKCLDYKYESTISSLRNESWFSVVAEGGRQWMYQMCNEFGFYQTSDSSPHIFGDKFGIDFFIRQCADVFGPKYTAEFLQQAVQRTNDFYGGLNPNASNIVYVHGSIDPWHALGITRSVSKSAPAIYIRGVAHCANMYPPKWDDPLQLIAARNRVWDLIQTWLGA